MNEEKWEVGFAQLFKQRNNKEKIGNIIGDVISVNPLRISILSGNIILDKSHLYISKGLTTKTFTSNITSSDVSGLVSCGGNLSNISISNGDTVLNFGLKNNDKVLLIPSESGQIFFIIDVIEKVI